MWVVWLLSLSLCFRTNITSSICFFRAHQQVKYEALVVMSLRLTYGGAGLAAILSGQGLLTLAALELAAQVPTVTFTCLGKISGPKETRD
jgi:hypothetical protein